MRRQQAALPAERRPVAFAATRVASCVRPAQCCLCCRLSPTLPPHRRPSITLACKRWARLVYSDPRLWRSVCIEPDVTRFPWAHRGEEAGEEEDEGEEDEAHQGRSLVVVGKEDRKRWLEANYGLLRRVAPVVEAFAMKRCHLVQHAATAADSWEVRAARPLRAQPQGRTSLPCAPSRAAIAACAAADSCCLPTDQPPPPQVHHFLRLLHPQRLRELSLNYLTKKVEPAVARLTSLTKLHFALEDLYTPPPSLPVLLGSLSGLRDLSVSAGRPGGTALAPIGRMSRLTALRVDSGWYEELTLPPIQQPLADSLRSLSLMSHKGIPPATAERVAALTALTFLELSAAGALLSSTMLSPLSALQQLQHLRLWSISLSSGGGSRMELSEVQQHLAALPSLAHFSFDVHYPPTGGGITVRREQPAPGARLPGRRLPLQGSASASHGQHACARPPPRAMQSRTFLPPPTDPQVGPLTLRKLGYRPCPQSHGRELRLSFHSSVGAPESLQALLEQLLQGCPLSGLTLLHSRLRPAALQHCPALASLTELHLGGVGPWPEGGSSVAALLPPMMRQAPQLAALHCDSLTTGSLMHNDTTLQLGAALPVTLVRSTGLTRLALPKHRLPDLQPAGPYLQGARAATAVAC